MNLENYQSYIFPTVLIAFFAFRFLSNKALKKKIPQLLSNGAVIVDVRSKSEFSGGHNLASLNIPLGELDKACHILDKEKMILLCCASGARSAMAVGILKKHGFKNVMNAGPWTNTIA